MDLSSPSRRAALMGLVALMTASLSACGGGAGSNTTPAADTSAGGAASKEPLRVGVDASLPPWETFDSSNKVVGIDADLAAAVGEELGRPIEWVNMGWSSLMPSLKTGRFDVIISSISDRAARREALSFVDYASPYPTFLVPKGNPKNVHSVNDVCGLTSVQVAGAAPEAMVQAASKSCEAAGKPAVNFVSVKTASDVTQAMKTGRAELWLEDVVTHQAALDSLGDGFEIVKASDVPTATFGIAVVKDNTELLNQIQQALQKVADRGELKKIAAKYNLPEEVFPSEVKVNQGEG